MSRVDPKAAAVEVRQIAKTVDRMPTAMRSDPEQIYIAKEGVVKALIALAKRWELAA